MSADDILLDRDLAALLRQAVAVIVHPSKFNIGHKQRVANGLGEYADRIDPPSDEGGPEPAHTYGSERALGMEGFEE